MSRNAFVIALICGGATAAAQDLSVTFNRDVLPILQKNCQTCHRPGEVAPMSFVSYKDARPWAKAMKVAVASRKMPPWFADPQYGHSLNDRALKQSDIDTIAKWADTGALEGDPKTAPPAVQWPEGWQIQPDVIVQGPNFDVPAQVKNNVIEWVSVTIPSGFKQDTWITSVQIRPEHPAVAHHICLGFNPHAPGIKYFDPVWQDKQRDEDGSASRRHSNSGEQRRRSKDADGSRRALL